MYRRYFVDLIYFIDIAKKEMLHWFRKALNSKAIKTRDLILSGIIMRTFLFNLCNEPSYKVRNKFCSDSFEVKSIKTTIKNNERHLHNHIFYNFLVERAKT